MVCNKFIVILSRFLKPENQDNELLDPICELHQVIAFEFRLHVPVRIIYSLVNVTHWAVRTWDIPIQSLSVLYQKVGNCDMTRYKARDLACTMWARTEVAHITP